jgi:hypothetical protein
MGKLIEFTIGLFVASVTVFCLYSMVTLLSVDVYGIVYELLTNR